MTDLPSDCEREPVNADQTGIGFSRAEMDYINEQICLAVDTALNTLSKAMSETKTSNVDAIRNLCLQLALNWHTFAGPDTAAEVVESARRFTSFLRGHDA